ncbi:LacI family DNA-binding transcriptional regulator [Microbacterium sp. Se63.02b]|uniref:LacI family DNA-binding transcriptional regulator n=1 Tax=Microbacterium sp. Se63.02b TaxID=2709304 RepID=UPI001FCF137E|nr:LacI family DNA-binding transcriptional regulator [Microbacterium sp. Se63.02b]
MRDVAAHAGVSTKTVSRVFNDDPHVLPHTRALVEQAMRELNYVPNVLATTFRAGRTSVIGVAVPDIVDPFFASIARAIEDVARERGLSTLVTSLGDEPDDERAAIESMLGRQLSGLVVAPVGVDHSWLDRWREHTPSCSSTAPPSASRPTRSSRPMSAGRTRRCSTWSRTVIRASPTSGTPCICRPRRTGSRVAQRTA